MRNALQGRRKIWQTVRRSMDMICRRTDKVVDV